MLQRIPIDKGALERPLKADSEYEGVKPSDENELFSNFLEQPIFGTETVVDSGGEFEEQRFFETPSEALVSMSEPSDNNFPTHNSDMKFAIEFTKQNDSSLPGTFQSEKISDTHIVKSETMAHKLEGDVSLRSLQNTPNSQIHTNIDLAVTQNQALAPTPLQFRKGSPKGDERGIKATAPKNVQMKEIESEKPIKPNFSNNCNHFSHAVPTDRPTQEQGIIENKGGTLANLVDVMDNALTNSQLSKPYQSLFDAVRDKFHPAQLSTPATVFSKSLVKPSGNVLQAITVQLTPIELGRIELHLRMDEGELIVQVNTETEVARTNLTRDHELIVSNLRSLGYKVDTIVINPPAHAGEPTAREGEFGSGDTIGQEKDRERHEQEDSERVAPSPVSDVVEASTSGTYI